MANQPIGITFMPSADAAANGPRQASIEGGTGGSDLASAFKILSLHLPQVLGAKAIAPKRLLTSQGSRAVAAPDGASPYAAVFQALLQSMTGAQNGVDVGSLSSIYGGNAGGGPDLGASASSIYGGAPPPNIKLDDPLPRSEELPPPPPTETASPYRAVNDWSPPERRTRYL